MTMFSINKKIQPNLYDSPSSEPFRVTVRLFNRFYSRVINQNSLPIILLFPNQQDVIVAKKTGHNRYKAITSYFDSIGYNYINCLDVFTYSTNKIDTRLLFASDSGSAHYSPLANRMVAEHVFNYIVRNDLLTFKK